MRLVGTAEGKAGVLSFLLAVHQPLEVGKGLMLGASRCVRATNDAIAACRAPAQPGVGIRPPAQPG